MRNKFYKKITGGLIVTLLIVQLAGVILTLPSTAQAQVPGVPTVVIPGAPFPVIPTAPFPVVKVADPWQALKDIGVAALRSFALNISNKFLTRLTNKIQEKYRIRNYLYYDKYLSDYYLEYVLADKFRISDPNLYQIYHLMYRGYVSGTPTGANPNDPNAPDPRKALIPQMKKAISDYYVNKTGGIPSDQIYNPAANVTDEEYFAKAQAYFANPPVFTQQNLQGQFGEFQSAATTASQIEVSVGSGLKNGRVIGGFCSNLSDNAPWPNGTNNGGNWDPVSCAAGGGKWNASALDMARSFIDNPTAVIDKYLGAAILTKLDANFNPNNFWAMIGSLVGNFLFNELTLDTNSNNGGAYLPDYSGAYAPGRGLDGVNVGKGVDIDGDGNPDGYDNDGDGQLDVCIFGGVQDGSGNPTSGPPCRGSADPNINPGGGVPPGNAPPNSHGQPDQSAAVATAKAAVVADGIDISTPCGQFEITRRTAIAVGAGVLEKGAGFGCDAAVGGHFSVDIIVYQNGDLIDILSSPESGLNPQWGSNGTTAGCSTECHFVDPNTVRTF